MKVLLVAVTYVTLVSVKAHHHFNQAAKGKVYQYHQECKTETGIDEKQLDDTKTADKIDDPKIREYIWCFSKKIGFQNEEGEFQKDVIRTKLEKYSHDQDRIDRILANCTVQKETAVDSAVGYFLCHRDNSPDYKDFFFYVVDLTDEQRKKIREHKEICIKETELKQETLAQVEKGNFPDDADFKRFVLCLLKRIGLLDGEGKIDEKITRAKLNIVLKNADIVESIMKLCLKEQDSPEETAFQMTKCFYGKFYFNLVAWPTQEELNRAREYNEACKPISGILPEELAEAKKGIIPDTDTFKKHLFCLYSKCGIVDEKGVLNKEAFSEKFSKHANKDEVERVYEKCNIVDGTPENNSFKIFNCFLQNVSKAVNIFTLL